MAQPLTFKCHNCGNYSKFSKPQDEDVMRFRQEEGPKKIRFLCEYCGTSNEIEFSEENIKFILVNYFNTGGDMDGLINIFKKL